MRACEPEPEPEPEPRAYFASHCVFFCFFFKFNVNILLSKCYTWLKKQNFPIFFRALISAQVVFLSVSNLISSNGFRRSVYSGAPAARRAAKRSPIIIEKGTTRMHRNRNPCNSFLLVKMASGMDHGRVRPTTTTTTNDVAAIFPFVNKRCHF